MFIKLDGGVGAARASGLYKTGGAYHREPAVASGAVQTRKIKLLTKSVARETLNLIRVSLQRARWLRTRPAVIHRYLADHPVKKLQLGSGPVLLPGWLNADFRPRTPQHVYIDVTERFPFEDGTFDYLFQEHLIGDLTYPQAGQMLAECYRVLKPGGRLRIATPNLQKLAELYADDRSPLHDRYVAWAIEEFVGWADAPLPGLVINNLFQEHPFIYDPATLQHVLARAGFIHITERAFGESDDPHFNGIDAHGKVLGHPEISGFESVTMEAVRG